VNAMTQRLGLGARAPGPGPETGTASDPRPAPRSSVPVWHWQAQVRWVRRGRRTRRGAWAGVTSLTLRAAFKCRCRR
jgi:hypothetical protein